MKTELALRYNNKSVLESYSCTLTMDLLSKHKLLRNLKGEVTEEKFRTSIIKMILATDMVFHYELQENLAGLLDIVASRLDEEEEEEQGQVKDIFESKGDKSPLENFSTKAYFVNSPVQSPSLLKLPPSAVTTRLPPPPDNPIHGRNSISAAHKAPPEVMVLDRRERQMLCQILLHGADISNALRPWAICSHWSDLVCEEFFRQGEAERQHGLPISPNMDRDHVKQSTIGLQFGDFVVSPYFEIFAAMFPRADKLVKALADNRREWLKLEGDAGGETTSTAHPKDGAGSGEIPTAPLHAEGDERFPDNMLPDRAILNPKGRRVSVAAGMVIIPDELEERVIGSGKSRRKYLGLRSVSDTGIPEDIFTDHRTYLPRYSPSPPCVQDRRRSEEPGYYLHRNKVQLTGERPLHSTNHSANPAHSDRRRRLSRSDLVDRCLEHQQQCFVASHDR